MTHVDRHENLARVVAAIQQKWGKNALRRLERSAADTAFIATGHAAFDQLLGLGGVPRGALTCLSGYPTSGKRTLALDVLTRVQQHDEITVYLDIGGTFDPEYAEGRGVDLAQMLVVRPHPPSHGIDITRDIITSGGAGLIIIDTSSSNPQAHQNLEGLSRAVRYLSNVTRRAPYAVLCLVAAASDVLSRTLMARADVHIRMAHDGWLRDEGRVHGYVVRLTTVKNRFAPVQAPVTIPIMVNTSMRRFGS